MQNNPICQSTKKPVVAAFDFDGTISKRDSLPYFLYFTSGFFKTFFKLAMHVPLFISYFLNLRSRQQVKESLLKSFFEGMPIETLKEKGKEFAKGSLNKMIKQEALEEIKKNQAMGIRCILVSANLDVYLDEFAYSNGFHDSITSKVAFDKEGRVTGYLEGVNCRGIEKVRRLEQLLGLKDNYILYAYGDSDGDKEMLELADYPFYRVFKK